MKVILTQAKDYRDANWCSEWGIQIHFAACGIQLQMTVVVGQRLVGHDMRRPSGDQRGR